MSLSFDELCVFLSDNLEKDFVFSYHDSRLWIGGTLMRIEPKKDKIHVYFAYYKVFPSYIEKDWFHHTINRFIGKEPKSNFPFRMMTDDERILLQERNRPILVEYRNGFSFFRSGSHVKFFDGSKLHRGSGNFMIVNLSDCDTILSNHHSPLVSIDEQNAHLIFPLTWGFFDEQHKCVWFMFVETESISPPTDPSPQIKTLDESLTLLTRTNKGVNVLIRGPACCGKESFVQDVVRMKHRFAFRLPSSWIHEDCLSSKLEFSSTHKLPLLLKFDSDTKFESSFFHFLDTHKTIVFLLTSESHDILDEQLSRRVHLFLTLDAQSDSSQMNNAQKRLFSSLTLDESNAITSQYQHVKRVVMYS